MLEQLLERLHVIEDGDLSTIDERVIDIITSVKPVDSHDGTMNVWDERETKFMTLDDFKVWGLFDIGNYQRAVMIKQVISKDIVEGVPVLRYRDITFGKHFYYKESPIKTKVCHPRMRGDRIDGHSHIARKKTTADLLFRYYNQQTMVDGVMLNHWQLDYFHNKVVETLNKYK